MIRKYSNRTLSEFAEFINSCFTRTEMNSLFLCVSLQDDFDYGSNKLALILSVLKKLSYSGEPEHSDILDALFDETVKRRQEAFEQSEHPEELRSKEVASLLRALKADGFEILDGRIIPTDQLGSELMAEVSVLHQRLQTREMDDINKILDQAHQNFIEGRHESCNAMLRSSLEGTLKHIAVIAAGGPDKIPASNRRYGPSPADIRKYLHQVGFFEDDEIEYIKVFYGYASTDGSHPGLSNESESRLRRLMIVALIQYCMEKLESKYP